MATYFLIFRDNNPKLNPSLPFVIWNLVVQCQRDPYNYTYVIVPKLQKSFFFGPLFLDCLPITFKINPNLLLNGIKHCGTISEQMKHLYTTYWPETR